VKPGAGVCVCVCATRGMRQHGALRGEQPLFNTCQTMMLLPSKPAEKMADSSVDHALHVVEAEEDCKSEATSAHDDLPPPHACAQKARHQNTAHDFQKTLPYRKNISANNPAVRVAGAGLGCRVGRCRVYGVGIDYRVRRQLQEQAFLQCLTCP